MEFEITYLTRVIAAADHCLADAYAGRCPGIFRDDVLQVRLPELMAREEESSAKKALIAIEEAGAILRAAEKRVRLGGTDVADVRHLGPVPFLMEAGVMMGIPYLAKLDKRFSHKVNLSGPDVVIKNFLGRER